MHCDFCVSVDTYMCFYFCAQRSFGSGCEVCTVCTFIGVLCVLPCDCVACFVQYAVISSNVFPSLDVQFRSHNAFISSTQFAIFVFFTNACQLETAVTICSSSIAIMYRNHIHCFRSMFGLRIQQLHETLNDLHSLNGFCLWHSIEVRFFFFFSTQQHMEQGVKTIKAQLHFFRKLFIIIGNEY